MCQCGHTRASHGPDNECWGCTGKPCDAPGVTVKMTEFKATWRWDLRCVLHGTLRIGGPLDDWEPDAVTRFRAEHWGCRASTTSVLGPVDPDGCCAERMPRHAILTPEATHPQRPVDTVGGHEAGINAGGGVTPVGHDGCDCTELCSMGPTCPSGSLARLPGSGCWRTAPTAASIAAGLRAEQDAEADERLAKGLRGERG